MVQPQLAQSLPSVLSSAFVVCFFCALALAFRVLCLHYVYVRVCIYTHVGRCLCCLLARLLFGIMCVCLLLHVLFLLPKGLGFIFCRRPVFYYMRVFVSACFICDRWGESSFNNCGGGTLLSFRGVVWRQQCRHLGFFIGVQSHMWDCLIIGALIDKICFHNWNCPLGGGGCDKSYRENRACQRQAKI